MKCIIGNIKHIGHIFCLQVVYNLGTDNPYAKIQVKTGLTR